MSVKKCMVCKKPINEEKYYESLKIRPLRYLEIKACQWQDPWQGIRFEYHVCGDCLDMVFEGDRMGGILPFYAASKD